MKGLIKMIAKFLMCRTKTTSVLGVRKYGQNVLERKPSGNSILGDRKYLKGENLVRGKESDDKGAKKFFEMDK